MLARFPSISLSLSRARWLYPSGISRIAAGDFYSWNCLSPSHHTRLVSLPRAITTSKVFSLKSIRLGAQEADVSRGHERTRTFKATRTTSDDEKEASFVMHSLRTPALSPLGEVARWNKHLVANEVDSANKAGCVYRIHFCAAPVAARDVKWRTLDSSRLQTLRVPCNFFPSPFPRSFLFNSVYRCSPSPFSLSLSLLFFSFHSRQSLFAVPATSAKQPPSRISSCRDEPARF